MDLQEFVTTSLIQIVEGVNEAQRSAGASGASIAPRIRRKGNAKGGTPSNGENRQDVMFDVAVTVTENNGLNGNAGLSVPFFKLGGELSAEQENSTISRIKFVVPVVLPSNT